MFEATELNNRNRKVERLWGLLFLTMTVLLISDGHETRGDARAAARRLGRRGFAIHVAALGGRSPEVGLYAADLPRQVEIGTPTFTRLLLANGAQRQLPLDCCLSCSFLWLGCFDIHNICRRRKCWLSYL